MFRIRTKLGTYHKLFFNFVRSTVRNGFTVMEQYFVRTIILNMFVLISVTVRNGLTVTPDIFPTINVEPICDTTLANRTSGLPLQQGIKQRNRNYGIQKSQ